MSTRSEAAVRDAENRRARLRQWIDENFGGVQAAFVTRHSLNQGEISALLKDKSFGSVKARNLEAKTGMPERYLDVRPGELSLVALTKEPQPIDLENNPDYPAIRRVRFALSAGAHVIDDRTDPARAKAEANILQAAAPVQLLSHLEQTAAPGRH